MNCPWLIAGPNTRWLKLTRRFAPTMQWTSEDILTIEACPPLQVAARLRHMPRAIAIWTLDDAGSVESQLPVVTNLLRQPLLHPSLHFASIDPRLDHTTRLSLQMLGIILLDRPEQFPAQRKRIARFWRATRQE